MGEKRRLKNEKRKREPKDSSDYESSKLKTEKS
jgi:hypothetical protein